MSRVFTLGFIVESNFLLVWVCRNIKTKRIAGRRVGEAATGGNQAPPEAPNVGVQVPVNLAALTGWRS